MFPEVKIFRYITKGTFDAYSWQLIENKQRFISQIMTSKSPVRSADDIDESALSYAEVKALATGNPYIKEKMNLDIQVSKLKLLKANHTSQIYRLQDNLVKNYPKSIQMMKERIAGYESDIEKYQKNKPKDADAFSIKVGEKVFTDRKEGGEALIAYCKKVKIPKVSIGIGEFLGFPLAVNYDVFFQVFRLEVKGELTHEIDMSSNPFGNLQKLSNLFEGLDKKKESCLVKLTDTEKQMENARIEVKKPFAQEAELAGKLERLNELNAMLNMDEQGTGSVETEQEETDKVHPPQQRSLHEKLSNYQSQIKPESVQETDKERKNVACL